MIEYDSKIYRTLGWDEYNMGFAQHASRRASCPRASVGAAAFLDNRILLTGYNGAPPKHRQCDEIGCLMVNGHCIRARHAEQNLIATAEDRKVSLVGSTLYTTHRPCENCAGRIADAGVHTVIYRLEYGADNGLDALADMGVAVRRIA